jgi:hypothetical protein
MINFENIKAVLTGILTTSGEFLLGILTSLLIFVSPIKGMLLLTILMVVFDTILGIYTSIKVDGLSSFKSNKLFNLSVKLFFYLGAIILSYCVDEFIIIQPIIGIQDLFPKVVCFAFVYIEGKSMDESSIKLGNKSMWVILKEIVKKISSLKKDLNDLSE